MAGWGRLVGYEEILGLQVWGTRTDTNGGGGSEARGQEDKPGLIVLTEKATRSQKFPAGKPGY